MSQQKNDLVTVIIPVYNVEDYLDACLDSVAKQTYHNIEIILVDDGSPDACPAMCDAWAAQDGRIKVIHKENGGMSDARNAGISQASGKWIVFIDSDDVVSPQLVEILVREAKTDLCLPAAMLKRFSDTVPESNFAQLEVRQVCSSQLSKVRNGMFAVAALYRRDIIDQEALRFVPSLRNLEDVVWNAIYLRYVDTVRLITAPMYYYRINPSSITSRCVDREWQVSSWLAARAAILNWFDDKQLSSTQKKEIQHIYRHCQNNIYAECLVGNIPSRRLRALELANPQNAYNDKLLPMVERIMSKKMPWLYDQFNFLMLRLRRMISRGLKK